MGKLFYSVDKISNGSAVLIDDDEQEQTIDLNLLPQNLKESDVLVFCNDSFTLDPNETNRRLAENQALLDKLLHKND